MASLETRQQGGEIDPASEVDFELAKNEIEDVEASDLTLSVLGRVALDYSQNQENLPTVEEKAEATDLLEALATHGSVSLDVLTQAFEELDLGPDEVNSVLENLEILGIEIESPTETYVEEVDEKEKSSFLSRDSLGLFLDKAGEHNILTAAQEVELSKRIERGDDDAKKELVEHNIKLAVSVAKRYRNKGLPFLDLINESIIGLYRAADKFDWRKGYKFSTYATWWLRQSCQRAVADKGRVIRVPVHIHEHLSKMNRARSRLEQQLNRQPTVPEIAAEAKLPIGTVKNALSIPEAVSGDAPLGEDDDGLTLLDFSFDDSHESVGEGVDEERRKETLDEALRRLDPRARTVLELRYGISSEINPEGKTHTLEDIGKHFGVTREAIRNVENQALTAMAQDHKLYGAREDGDNFTKATTGNGKIHNTIHSNPNLSGNELVDDEREDLFIDTLTGNMISLNKTEQNILRFLSEGLDYAQIAARMALSVGRTKARITKIYSDKSKMPGRGAKKVAVEMWQGLERVSSAEVEA